MLLIKSPLNYTGGKFRLLPQLQEHFPQDIGTFVDLFTGGANVVANVNATKSLAYDIDDHLIKLYQYLEIHKHESVVSKLYEIINHYSLSDSTTNGYAFYGCDSSKGLGSYNKEKFTKLRDDFNSKVDRFPRELLFFSLIIFGFNNQIRYNKSGNFNMPVGKRDFNSRVQENLKQFMNSLQSKNISFEKRDFRNLNLEELKPGDFVYADPPYLITTAAYNEQNGWTELDETALHELLDKLNEKKVFFALSNVMEKDGAKNTLLEEWSKKYTVHNMNISYQNSNYQKKENSAEREVLVTNY